MDCKLTAFTLAVRFLRITAPVFVIALYSADLFAANWFVSTSKGTNGEPIAINYPPTQGMAESAPFRTISFALHYASPGDTIFVKAGNYGAANDDYSEINQNRPTGFRDSDGIVVDKANIKIVGYNQVYDKSLQDPNLPQETDLDNNEGIPSNYIAMEQLVNDPTNSSLSEMPEIGNANDDDGTAIKIKADDVTICNFRLTRFKIGVDAIKLGQTLHNPALARIICVGQGSRVVNEAIGWGIALRSTSGGSIDSCVAYNVSRCGFYIQDSVTPPGSSPTSNWIDDCEAYVDDTSAAGSTDYAFDISNSSFNEVSNCYVERIGNGPTHGVHAFAVQANDSTDEESKENRFTQCTAVNTWELFYLRGAGATDNTFEDSTGTGTVDQGLATMSIFFDTGPSNNHFSRIRLIKPARAIRFGYEDGVDSNATSAGTSNTFDNCVFTDIWRGVIGHSYQTDLRTTKEATGTLLNNCTFVARASSPTAVIWTNREGSSNHMQNCIITGFDKFTDKYPITGDTTTYEHGWTFDHCGFHNPGATGFPTLHGVNGNIVADPQFHQGATGVELSYGSPYIDTGAARTEAFDFSGNTRTAYGGIGLIIDIGALEKH